MCSISPLQKVLLPESWLLPRCQDWPLDKRRSLGQVPSAHFRKRIPISTVERENIIPSPPASFLSPFSGIQLDSALEYVFCSQVRGIGVVIVPIKKFLLASSFLYNLQELHNGKYQIFLMGGRPCFFFSRSFTTQSYHSHNTTGSRNLVQKLIAKSDMGKTSGFKRINAVLS